MRLALCNEVLRDRDFAAQCAYAAALGYDALEVAPFTLGADPLELAPSRRAGVRRAARDAGIAISGLHWLLVKPEGLSVTSPDARVRARTIDAAIALVREVGSPALATMLDTKSAALAESASAVELLRRWLPSGLLRHVHLNDRNRRGPGQGKDRFAPVLAALVEGGYAGDIAIEPFDYVPDASGCAARVAGYVRGLLEGLDPVAGASAAPG